MPFVITWPFSIVYAYQLTFYALSLAPENTKWFEKTCIFHTYQQHRIFLYLCISHLVKVNEWYVAHKNIDLPAAPIMTTELQLDRVWETCFEKNNTHVRCIFIHILYASYVSMVLLVNKIVNLWCNMIHIHMISWSWNASIVKRRYVLMRLSIINESAKRSR